MKQIPERKNLIISFLAKNNINNYTINKIAGDASFRSYYRIITDNNNSLILMDAPPEFEDIKPFYSIDQFLIKNNFSAPKIYAKDYQNGFLLLEDFGDNSYTKVLNKLSKSQLIKEENELYKLAIDLLLNLHEVKAPRDLAIYNQELLIGEVMLFIDWYLPCIAKKSATKTQIKEFKDLWLKLFSKMSKPTKLVLRDYHADNLMLLKNHNNYQKVGLLDFQDAVIGARAYDVVSLLEDARRDVNEETVQNMIQYYLDNSDINQENFLYDYQLLSLQRNIKIIGIFSRLAIRDKKENYLKFLPKMFNYVNIRLQDEFLKEMKEFLSIFIHK